MHITGLCYGPDGTDLLASYSDGPVVRFDVTKDSVGWDVTTRNTLTIYTGAHREKNASQRRSCRHLTTTP